jgi:hypothetical protein
VAHHLTEVASELGAHGFMGKLALQMPPDSSIARGYHNASPWWSQRSQACDERQ